MNRILFTITIIACATISVNAQKPFDCRIDTIYINPDTLPNTSYHSCHIPNPLEPDTIAMFYSNMIQYIPDMDTLKPLHVPPIKTIRLNFNVIQKNDGTGNFLDNDETRIRIRRIIQWINDTYSKYPPSDTINWVTELPDYDSRIRFSIGEYNSERIYFYKNSLWWDPNNDINNNSTNAFLAYLASNYPDRLEGVNIIVYGNHNYTNNHASALPPNYSDYNRDQFIKTYHWIPDADYGISCLLGHECAHIMGLRHTYIGGGASAICDQNDPDFLKDVFLVALPDSSNCPHNCSYSTNPSVISGDRITNNILGGTAEEHYISPMQAGQMHRALSISSARKYVSSEKSEVPLIISNRQFWDIDMKLYQDLIIDEGGELTIGCHLVMHQDVKIIVKPGGTLIVDGAVIGTDIYEKRMWQGIEVWGNSSESQYHFQDGFRQGYLELKNGAVVENAVCAIELWHPGHWNTTGGIVYANDAVFRNNAKTVHALHYTNYHPANNLELTYNSYFDNCEFIIDTNYLGTETFNKHVDLDHVNGILFRGCDFSTNRSVPGVSQQCIGIGAYSAGFTIDSNCESNVSPCPTNSIDHCTFTGFKNGITVTNDGTGTRSFCVRDAVFTNNDRGIYAQNSGFATILNNEFCVGGTADCSYGVYAEGVSGFCIEENSFRPVQGSIGTTYGIGIYNSLGANDIYLNSFGELSCGNLAYGINTAGDGSPFGTGLSGLTYTCNNNSGNAIDFCVLKDNGRGGIHDIQGSLSLPAGNTFSGSMYHFYNDGSDTIHYYYKSGASGQSPLSSKTYRVATQSTTNTNGCNSHYGGGVIKSPEEKKALAHAYHIADSMYTVLKSIYDKIKDDDVTYLISQMARYAHERCLAAGDIVRSDLNDTVIDLTELRLWLGNMKDLASDRLIVSTYIHEGDFTSAIALANTFPATYSLQSDDLSEHYEYMTLLDLYRTLYDSGRNIHELTEDEMKVVSDIAVNGHGTSKLMAGSIMTDIPNRDVMSFICPDLPRVKDGRDMNAISDNTADETDAFALGIVPNPAINWVTIDYVLPDKEFKATMTIINSLGVRVMSVVLDNCQGTKTINLSDVPAGVYGYTVKCGEYQKTGKLVINK